MTVFDPCRTYPGRRLGTVYCYHTWRPDHSGLPTRVTEVGYVGQTVQLLAVRDGQHRGTTRGPYGAAPQCQPWSDIVVGEVSIVEQGMWRYDELLEREQFHIQRLHPRYNHAGNLANGYRVPVPEARRQRQSRDRARGAQVTTWPTRTVVTGPSSNRRRSQVRRRVVRRAVRRTPRRVLRRSGWAAAATLAVLVLGPTMHLPWRLWLITALAVTLSPLASLPRKRDRRQLAAATLAIAAMALFVVAS